MAYISRLRESDLHYHRIMAEGILVAAPDPEWGYVFAVRVVCGLPSAIRIGPLICKNKQFAHDLKLAIEGKGPLGRLIQGIRISGAWSNTNYGEVNVDRKTILDGYSGASRYYYIWAEFENPPALLPKNDNGQTGKSENSPLLPDGGIVFEDAYDLLKERQRAQERPAQQHKAAQQQEATAQNAPPEQDPPEQEPPPRSR